MPTTVKQTYQQPDTTATETDVEYSTITSLCPVTQVTTIAGTVYTTTYTTTSLIKTVVPNTVQKTVKQPDTTATATDVEYSTITSLCPVTHVTTIAGTVYTTTYTTTSLNQTVVPKTVQQTVKQPDTTVYATDVEYSTITSLCPVTQIVTVGGETQTVTYTTTNIVVVPHVNTVLSTIKGPGYTETETEGEYVTQTQGQYVTNTIVVPGINATSYVYSTGTVVHTYPTTVAVSHTAVPPPPPPPSAPSALPTAAAQTNSVPVIALMAGVVGLIAVL